jgi:hypothetical protein
MANTYTLIEAKTLGSNAASMSFTSIPSTYTDLCLLISARSTRATYSDDSLAVTFNGNTSSYSSKHLEGNGSSASSYSGGSANVSIYIPADGAATANTFSNNIVYIPNYAGSSNKSLSVDDLMETNATTAYMSLIAGLWSNTAAINQITLTGVFGNIKTNSSAYLYGIKNS